MVHSDKAFVDKHLDILAVAGCNLDMALLLPLLEEEAYHKVHLVEKDKAVGLH